MATNLPKTAGRVNARTRLSNDLATEFKWRDQRGRFHPIKEMETSHLFFTFRMIWNHSMPAEARVGNRIQRYSFPSFYTTSYMREACLNIYPELDKRTDLAPFMRRELEDMRRYFVEFRNKIVGRQMLSQNT